MHAVFINPGRDTDPFFSLAVGALEIVARDLEVTLEVLEGRRDRSRMLELAKSLAERDSPPDALLLVNDQEIAGGILGPVTAAGIEVVMIFDGFSTADRLTHGDPAERHEKWLAEVLPDDFAVGRQLAEHLIRRADEASLRGADGTLKLGALAGPFTIASVLRLNGLRSFILEEPGIELVEVVPAGWDRRRAVAGTLGLLDRNPETAVLWSANDAMGLGALEALEIAGRRAGEDILVGGVDWASEAIEAIRDGRYEVSFGGHFLDGAFALMLLYAHHHGRPIIGMKARTRLVPLTSATLDGHAALLDHAYLESIDFSRFQATLATDPDAVYSAEQLLAGAEQSGPVDEE